MPAYVQAYMQGWKEGAKKEGREGGGETDNLKGTHSRVRETTCTAW